MIAATASWRRAASRAVELNGWGLVRRPRVLWMNESASTMVSATNSKPRHSTASREINRVSTNIGNTPLGERLGMMVCDRTSNWRGASHCIPPSPHGEWADRNRYRTDKQHGSLGRTTRANGRCIDGGASAGAECHEPGVGRRATPHPALHRHRGREQGEAGRESNHPPGHTLGMGVRDERSATCRRGVRRVRYDCVRGSRSVRTHDFFAISDSGTALARLDNASGSRSGGTHEIGSFVGGELTRSAFAIVARLPTCAFTSAYAPPLAGSTMDPHRRPVDETATRATENCRHRLSRLESTL